MFIIIVIIIVIIIIIIRITRILRITKCIEKFANKIQRSATEITMERANDANFVIVIK
jgi:cell division protein FtsL